MAWNIAMFTMVCGAVYSVSLIFTGKNFNNNICAVYLGYLGYLGSLFGLFGGMLCILVLFFGPLLIGITLENYEGFGVGETYCSTNATSPRCCQQAALAVIGSSGYTILFGWLPAVVILLLAVSTERWLAWSCVFIMLCLQLPGIGIQMGALFGSN